MPTVEFEVDDETYARLEFLASSWSMTLPEYFAWLAKSLPVDPPPMTQDDREAKEPRSPTSRSAQ